MASRRDTVNHSRSSDGALRHFCSRYHTLTLSLTVLDTLVDLAITLLFRPLKNIDDDDDDDDDQIASAGLTSIMSTNSLKILARIHKKI